MRQGYVCRASDIVPSDIFRGCYVSQVEKSVDGDVWVRLCSRWLKEFKTNLRLPSDAQIIVRRRKEFIKPPPEPAFGHNQ